MPIANKSYMDGKGRMIGAGDTMPDDYDAPTLAHYKRLGIVGEAAGKPAKPAKSAKPNETKADPEAQATDEAKADTEQAAE